MTDFELISGSIDGLINVMYYGGIIAVIVFFVVRSWKRRQGPDKGSGRGDDEKNLWVERRTLELTSGKNMKWKKAWKQAEREYSMRPTGDGQPDSPVYLQQQATEPYEQLRMPAATHADEDPRQPVPSPQIRNTWPKALAIGGSAVVVLAVVGIVALGLTGKAATKNSEPDAVSSSGSTAQPSTDTSEGATALDDGSIGLLPLEERTTVEDLHLRELDLALSMEGSQTSLDQHEQEILMVTLEWRRLAENGSKRARAAYFCKAKSMELLLEAFQLAISGDDRARTVASLAEDYGVRGSDLLDELQYGTSLRAEGSPTFCR